MSQALLALCNYVGFMPIRKKTLVKEQHKNAAKHNEEQKRRRQNRDVFHAQLKKVLADLDLYCGTHKDIFTPSEFLACIKVEGEDFKRRCVTIHLPDKMIIKYGKSKRLLGVNHRLSESFRNLIVVRNFEKWHSASFFEQQQECGKHKK